VSATLRLFVAAEPPRAVCEELASWARRALARGGRARRLDSDSLHLTLCFLGEQPPEAVAEIAAALAAATELAAAVEDLHIGAPAWLPPRRPRVLAVEIGDPTGTLRALHEVLSRDLQGALGWEPPRQRFRPHVTLARMRPGSERARELPPTPPLEFAPVAVTLYRSQLDPAGAAYTALASIPPG
jgi:RNA 2',3'-cyclic 3'-phosphodiesterase